MTGESIPTAEIMTAPIRIGDEVVGHDFPVDVALDPEHLPAAAISQPELYAHYASLAREAQHRHRVLVAELERVRGGIAYEIRTSLEVIAIHGATKGVKSKAKGLSQKQIDAQIDTDPRYVEKLAIAQEAERTAQRLMEWREAFRQRADMLCILHGIRPRREEYDR